MIYVSSNADFYQDLTIHIDKNPTYAGFAQYDYPFKQSWG